MSLSTQGLLQAMTSGHGPQKFWGAGGGGQNSSGSHPAPSYMDGSYAFLPKKKAVKKADVLPSPRGGEKQCAGMCWRTPCWAGKQEKEEEEEAGVWQWSGITAPCTAATEHPEASAKVAQDSFSLCIPPSREQDLA